MLREHLSSLCRILHIILELVHWTPCSLLSLLHFGVFSFRLAINELHLLRYLLLQLNLLSLLWLLHHPLTILAHHHLCDTWGCWLLHQYHLGLRWTRLLRRIDRKRFRRYSLPLLTTLSAIKGDPGNHQHCDYSDNDNHGRIRSFI